MTKIARSLVLVDTHGTAPEIYTISGRARDPRITPRNLRDITLVSAEVAKLMQRMSMAIVAHGGEPGLPHQEDDCVDRS